MSFFCVSLSKQAPRWILRKSISAAVHHEEAAIPSTIGGADAKRPATMDTPVYVGDDDDAPSDAQSEEAGSVDLSDDHPNDDEASDTQQEEPDTQDNTNAQSDSDAHHDEPSDSGDDSGDDFGDPSSDESDDESDDPLSDEFDVSSSDESVEDLDDVEDVDFVPTDDGTDTETDEMDDNVTLVPRDNRLMIENGRSSSFTVNLGGQEYPGSNRMEPGYIIAEMPNVLFVGVFGGDGIHHFARHIFGIGFAVLHIIDLVRIAQHIGVPSPKLSLRAETVVSVLAAGRLGRVTWSAVDRQIERDWTTTGLPSSRVIDTDLDVLNLWFPVPSPLTPHYIDTFLLLFLGIWWADGSCIFSVPESNVVQCAQATICARDVNILNWIGERWHQIGGEDGAIAWRNTVHVWSILLTPAHVDNRRLFTRATRLASTILDPLPPKIQAIHTLLSNDDVPVTAFSAKVNMVLFTDFVAPVANDPLGRVVAQDFYRANVFMVNEFLRVLGQPEIENINELDLTAFLRSLLAFQNPQQTMQGHALVAYTRLLTRRALPLTIEPQNTRIAGHRCAECDMVIRHRRDFERHQVQAHNHPMYPCTEPACEGIFIHLYSLALHIRNVHAGPQTRTAHACPDAHCDLVFPNMEDRDEHARRHERNFFACVYCPYHSANRSDLSQHYQAQHQNLMDGTRYRCPHPGCPQTHAKPYGILHHFYMVHQKARHRCNQEGCVYETAVRGKMHRHLLAVHGIRWERILRMNRLRVNQQQMHACTLDNCLWWFPNQADRDAHVSRHGDRANACFHCAHNANSATDLTQHYREAHPQSFQEGRYHCPIDDCTHHAVDRSKLYSHILAAHQNAILKCDQQGCHHETTNDTAMTTHYRRIHEMPRPRIRHGRSRMNQQQMHACTHDDCLWWFLSQADRDAHMLIHGDRAPIQTYSMKVDTIVQLTIARTTLSTDQSCIPTFWQRIRMPS
ncbi:hypothetical protein BC940DRAFT_333095 [Gongronella butleri]|nr:hypothetical protein BC940DRAFT_333095 [Gongronella butleri]